MRSVCVISGPTGSGKTHLALRCAPLNSKKIVNADAFQIYQEIPILGAQPAASHQGSFVMLSQRSIAEPISAGEFSRQTERYLNSDYLWVGTGLYLGAALYGLDPLGKKGTPFQGSPKVSYRMVVLDPPRAELYQALNERVDEMLKQGAIEEAQNVYRMIEAGRVPLSNPVLKAIGLKHLLQTIRGELTESEAIRIWKRDTRRLAKRQWTWLRKFCPPSSTVLWTQDFDQAIHFLSLPSS